MSAAPTARAKIAVWEERDLGELDINVLEDGRAPLGGERPMREQARVDPGPNRDHSIRRAWVSRNDEPVG